MNVRSIALHHLARTRPTRPVPPRSNTNMAAKGPRWVSPTATYIICTNPRSGSWLLSEGLTATSLAGKPREWFNILEEQQYRARWRMGHSSDLSYETYLDLARAESTTANGISGIKLHYYQFAELPKTLEAIENFRGLAPARLMARLFPQARYLWLTRRDKPRQAISFFMASSTDEWWSIEGITPAKREGSIETPEFDPLAIARVEQVLVESDAKWQAHFEHNQIAPLVIHYEDLLSDYPGTIVSVLKWLGVPNADAVHVPPARLRRQSNGLNEEWLARYAAFKRAVAISRKVRRWMGTANRCLSAWKTPSTQYPVHGSNGLLKASLCGPTTMRSSKS